MTEELKAMIRDARKTLRKAAGHRLTPEEETGDMQAAEVAKLRSFIMRTIGIREMMNLLIEVAWSDAGPVATLNADGQVFHLRKRRDNGTDVLYILKDEEDRELVQVDGNDPIFASRIVAAIGDAIHY